MEEKIKIDIGIKRILINDGPEYVEFNPTDIAFAERFYELIRDWEEKRIQYIQRAKDLDIDSGRDEFEVPDNMAGGLALMREMCEFMRSGVDKLFGDGTCAKLFGEVLSMELFDQFFSGIMPFIQKSRTDRISQYTKKTTKKVVMT